MVFLKPLSVEISSLSCITKTNAAKQSQLVLKARQMYLNFFFFLNDGSLKNIIYVLSVRQT